MSKQTFFSIVIPALNEENYIGGILGDLKNQDFIEKFEVIVVDGNSEDKTREIAKNLGAKVLISEKRHVSTQRNMGGNAATGEYIIFFDADTRVSNTFLSELNQQIKDIKENNSDVFSSLIDTSFIDNQNINENIYDKLVVECMNIGLEISSLIKFPTIPGAFIGCKKTLFNEIQFHEAINFTEDFEFIRKALSQGYTLRLFKHPRYHFSMRRFKKEGYIKYLLKFPEVIFKILTKGYEALEAKDYPMLGGNSYQEITNSPRKQQILDRLNAILEKINKYKLEDLIQKIQKF